MWVPLTDQCSDRLLNKQTFIQPKPWRCLKSWTVTWKGFTAASQQKQEKTGTKHWFWGFFWSQMSPPVPRLMSTHQKLKSNTPTFSISGVCLNPFYCCDVPTVMRRKWNNLIDFFKIKLYLNWPPGMKLAALIFQHYLHTIFILYKLYIPQQEKNFFCHQLCQKMLICFQTNLSPGVRTVEMYEIGSCIGF